MNILIGCEESGVVRDAFLRMGHKAWSNDLIPARNGGPHLQMDIFEALDWTRWDIIILHPDCTALAVSGNRYYGRGTPGEPKRLAAIDWTTRLWNCAKDKARIGCALENPVSVIWNYIGRPQYIQPFEFGHGEQKKTGILTHKLPPLRPTNLVAGREQRVWLMPPSLTRKRDRSETYLGIAEAMAYQWGIRSLPHE